MVARTDGRAKLVAKVDGDRCVSCGICAGSCDVSAVGPPGRNGRDQASWATDAFGAPIVAGRVVVLACAHGAAAFAESLEADGAVVAPVRCVGSVHPSVIEAAVLAGARGVLLVGCPPRDCWNREGPKWAAERLAGRREARLPSSVHPSAVRLVAATATDVELVRQAIRTLLGAGAA